NITFFYLVPLISRGGLVLGGTQGPKCFSRFKRSFRTFPPTSTAQHRLTPHFPYSSQGMRSGFALRPFPSHSPVSVQDFYPTLVKREDTKSGFIYPSSKLILKILSTNPFLTEKGRLTNICR